jgi:PAS domain S-box-containing protein
MTDRVAKPLVAVSGGFTRWSVATALRAVLVGGGYYAGSMAGFALRLPQSGISFLWPPTAILAAALMLAPPRQWTSYMVAALIAHGVAHALDGLSLGISLALFAGNAVQALLAAFLVRRFSRGSLLFSDLRTVIVFVVGGSIVAPAAAALAASIVYLQLGWATDFLHAWSARMLSNFIASLTIVPPIVLTVYQVRSGRPISLGRVLHFLGLLVTLIASFHVATDFWPGGGPGVPLTLYLPVPFLLWAAVRLGPAELSGALLCTILLTISSALRGKGYFFEATPADSVAAVQTFVAMTVVPMMLIAGLIEESRRERSAILESEQRTTGILRAIPDLMFLLTRDGTFLNYYASNAEQLLVSPDVFLGRNMRDVLPPDVVDKFASAFPQATADVPLIIEYSIELAGAQRHYETRLIALADDRILSIVRDITDRRQSETALRESERRYALATAAGGAGVWEFDVGEQRLYIDPALKRALGYREQEVSDSADAWMRLVHPDDLPLLTANFKAHAGGDSERMEVEHRILHRSGLTRWFLTRGEITERTKDGVVRITGTATDITARKEAESALKQAQDDLSQVSRLTALGELTVSIAHEVNQPLCAIVANANACQNWLEKPERVEGVRAALKDIVNDGHRASEVIKRTRELFTNRPPERRALSLNDVVREVLGITRERLRRAGVSLELRLDEALPLVYGDEVLIQQVTLNLVQNGIDAMQDTTDGRRILRVRSQSIGTHAVVSVRDTGTGLPRRNVKRVFDPFFTTKAHGTGIGLAISRSIVETHGGVLWATANTRAGATFRFKIPVIASRAHG